MDWTLTAETMEELDARLSSLFRSISMTNPDQAIDQYRRSCSFTRLSSLHHAIASYYLLLNESSLAHRHLIQALDAIQFSIAIAPQNEFWRTHRSQYLAILLGKQSLADEIATVLVKKSLWTDLERHRNFAFHAALAHLWLGETTSAEQYLDNIRYLETLGGHIFPGAANCLLAIIQHDAELLVESLELMLKKHHRMTVAWRSSYYNVPDGFVSERITLMVITALRYGLAVKSQLKGCQKLLKVPTFSPLDRPELPKGKRFALPVDYVPDHYLSVWHNRLISRKPAKGLVS